MAKTVLVTGASSGIGHACATHLLRHGFVVFAGVRKERDAERLQREGAGAIVPVEIDVTDGETIRSCLEEVRGRVGDAGLDGLVNNAGIGLTGPVEYLRPEALRRQFDVNVFGQIAVTQAFLPLIRRARGRIVNMGSVGSHIAIPFGGALGASKSAFRALNDSLRMELHPFGIHVAMIEPASINTPAVDKTLDADAAIAELPPEGVERYGAMMRAFIQRAVARERRGSSPDVVAAAVLQALTDERPRARYPVGKDVTLLMAMPWLLPDGLLDRIRYRLFGMPGRFAAAVDGR